MKWEKVETSSPVRLRNHSCPFLAHHYYYFAPVGRWSLTDEPLCFCALTASRRRYLMTSDKASGLTPSSQSARTIASVSRSKPCRPHVMKGVKTSGLATSYIHIKQATTCTGHCLSVRPTPVPCLGSWQSPGRLLEKNVGICMKKRQRGGIRKGKHGVVIGVSTAESRVRQNDIKVCVCFSLSELSPREQLKMRGVRTVKSSREVDWRGRRRHH
jgi:hypothetical protein